MCAAQKSNMVKVAYDWTIFAEQQFGGVSRYFAELATQLARSSDFQPHVVSPVYVNGYLRHAEFKVHGVRVPPLPLARLHRFPQRANTILSPLVQRALKPNIVHETWFTHGTRRRRVPTVATVHDMIHEKFANLFSTADTTSQRKRESVARADLVICVSEQTRRDLIEIFDVAPSKLRVTPLASSLGRAASHLVDAEQSALTDDKPFLLYVGARRGYKNFAGLLRAYAALGPACSDVRLVAFGGGPFSREERLQMSTLGLSSDRVQQRSGGDAALRQYYRGAIASGLSVAL